MKNEELVKKLTEAVIAQLPRNERGIMAGIIADAIRAALPAQEPVALRFPVMLRKMWSGGKVQEWLDALPPLYAAPSARVAELEARISDLELEAQLETCIREKLSEILTRTANVLKGEPDELTVHSWHDLAEIAGRRIAALDQQLAASREREGRMREAMAHARGWAPIGSQCMKILDAALAAEKGEK